MRSRRRHILRCLVTAQRGTELLAALLHLGPPTRPLSPGRQERNSRASAGHCHATAQLTTAIAKKCLVDGGRMAFCTSSSLLNQRQGARETLVLVLVLATCFFFLGRAGDEV